MATPVWPRRVATTPEAAQAARIKGLERRLSILERQNASGLQKYSANPADRVPGAAAGVVLDQVTFNIPDTSSRVLLWWRITLNNASAATENIVYISDGIDFIYPTNPYAMAYHIGTSTLAYWSFEPELVDVPVGTGKVYASPNARMMYGDPNFAYPMEPTPGDHTFALRGIRTAGTGATNYTGIHWWIAVI